MAVLLRNSRFSGPHAFVNGFDLPTPPPHPPRILGVAQAFLVRSGQLSGVDVDKISCTTVCLLLCAGLACCAVRLRDVGATR